MNYEIVARLRSDIPEMSFADIMTNAFCAQAWADRVKDAVERLCHILSWVSVEDKNLLLKIFTSDPLASMSEGKLRSALLQWDKTGSFEKSGTFDPYPLDTSYKELLAACVEWLETYKDVEFVDGDSADFRVPAKSNR